MIRCKQNHENSWWSDGINSTSSWLCKPVNTANTQFGYRYQSLLTPYKDYRSKVAPQKLKKINSSFKITTIAKSAQKDNGSPDNELRILIFMMQSLFLQDECPECCNEENPGNYQSNGGPEVSLSSGQWVNNKTRIRGASSCHMWNDCVCSR